MCIDAPEAIMKCPSSGFVEEGAGTIIGNAGALFEYLDLRKVSNSSELKSCFAQHVHRSS